MTGHVMFDFENILFTCDLDSPTYIGLFGYLDIKGE